MNNAKKPVTVGVSVPGELEDYSGSKSREFTNGLLTALVQTAWRRDTEDVEATNLHARITMDLLESFKPTDAVEGMIAAQAIAMHYASLECFRQAMIPDQSWEVAARMRKDGANLARGMADMVDALDRKRGKGPQVVRVERVVVHQGGQAIVGHVQAGAVAAAASTAPPALEQDPPGPMLDSPGTKPRPTLVKAGRHGAGGGA